MTHRTPITPAMVAYAAQVRRNIAARKLADGGDDEQPRDEYADERLGARELGVGRFHDGRGL